VKIVLLVKVLNNSTIQIEKTVPKLPSHRPTRRGTMDQCVNEIRINRRARSDDFIHGRWIRRAVVPRIQRTYATKPRLRGKSLVISNTALKSYAARYQKNFVLTLDLAFRCFTWALRGAPAFGGCYLGTQSFPKKKAVGQAPPQKFG
jgi:hypothetical protein